MADAGAKAQNTVAEALSKVLADSYAVYLKTHGYHWNVRGPQFASLHQMFMTQYTEIWTSIDLVAERIRALGELAPQGYGAFGKLSAIKDGDPAKDAEAMLRELAADNQTVAATAAAALKAAQEAGDEVSASLASDRIEAHEKNAWMLRASLP